MMRRRSIKAEAGKRRSIYPAQNIAISIHIIAAECLIAVSCDTQLSISNTATLSNTPLEYHCATNEQDYQPLSAQQTPFLSFWSRAQVSFRSAGVVFRVLSLSVFALSSFNPHYPAVDS